MIETGDKVRVVYDNSVGYVKDVISKDEYLVCLEDGFELVLSFNDVTLLDKDAKVPEEIEEVVFTPPQNTKEKLQISLVQEESSIFKVYISTSYEILQLSVFRSIAGKQELIAVANINDNNFHKIDQFTTLIEKLPEYTFYYTLIDPKSPRLCIQDIARTKISPKNISNLEPKSEFNGKGATFLSLNDVKKEQEDVKVDPNLLKEQMYSSNLGVINDIQSPDQVVDLHIEEICQDLGSIDAENYLRIQMAHFEKALDNAIFNGMDNITFIHGIGNRVLQSNIHKHLSKHRNVAYFKDAEKSKFGYGATYVKIK